MVFIDGENLVFRYQAMLAGNRHPAEGVVHVPDVFVWHPRIVDNESYLNVTRVYLYTSMVGDDNALRAMRDRIAAIIYQYDLGPELTGSAQIVPIIFKKAARANKSRQVDISIVIDMMRFAHSPATDLLYLVSGDGDFLPLVQEVMRHGKIVFVGAVSSGLAPELRHSVDEFFDLDRYLFEERVSGDASQPPH